MGQFLFWRLDIYGRMYLVTPLLNWTLIARMALIAASLAIWTNEAKKKRLPRGKRSCQLLDNLQRRKKGMKGSVSEWTTRLCALRLRALLPRLQRLLGMIFLVTSLSKECWNSDTNSISVYSLMWHFWPWASPRGPNSYHVLLLGTKLFFCWFCHVLKYIFW